MTPFWLILTYGAIAGVVSALTAPIPGTSLLLTGLEIYMVVHLSKKREAELGLKEIGYAAVAIYGVSTVLKDAALELLTFAPFIGWAAEAVIAVVFVLFLGALTDLYFSKKKK